MTGNIENIENRDKTTRKIKINGKKLKKFDWKFGKTGKKMAKIQKKKLFGNFKAKMAENYKNENKKKLKKNGGKNKKEK